MSSLSKTIFSSFPFAKISSHHLLHPSTCTFSFDEHLHMEPPYLCLISHWVGLCPQCFSCVILSSNWRQSPWEQSPAQQALLTHTNPLGWVQMNIGYILIELDFTLFAQSLWCPKALARCLISIKIIQVWCRGLTHVPGGPGLILDQGTCPRGVLDS